MYYIFIIPQKARSNKKKLYNYVRISAYVPGKLFYNYVVNIFVKWKCEIENCPRLLKYKIEIINNLQFHRDIFIKIHLMKEHVWLFSTLLYSLIFIYGVTLFGSSFVLMSLCLISVR
jgi:hypothetical protein